MSVGHHVVSGGTVCRSSHVAQPRKQNPQIRGSEMVQILYMDCGPWPSRDWPSFCSLSVKAKLPTRSSYAVQGCPRLLQPFNFTGISSEISVLRLVNHADCSSFFFFSFILSFIFFIFFFSKPYTGTNEWIVALMWCIYWGSTFTLISFISYYQPNLWHWEFILANGRGHFKWGGVVCVFKLLFLNSVQLLLWTCVWTTHVAHWKIKQPETMKSVLTI